MPISRLAPNSLPAVKVSRSWGDRVSLSGLMLGMLIVGVGPFISPLVSAAGVILTLFSWVGSWIAAWLLPPSEVTFGDFKTFRDLARVVATGAQCQ